MYSLFIHAVSVLEKATLISVQIDRKWEVFSYFGFMLYLLS